ncbi:MAG: hypothetical protein KC543_03165 [Myxococcales bacterium]|nr:hypothetical protein [Myxococcales bacterium]
MSLSAEQRVRYQRQVLLPEIGDRGQAALCEARFVVAPAEGADAGRVDPRAAQTAVDYLTRAGMHPAAPSTRGGAVVVGVASSGDVARIASGRPELEPAAAALLGALSAAEAMKAVVGAGRPMSPTAAPALAAAPPSTGPEER